MKFTLSQIKKNTVHGPFAFEQYVNVSELVHLNNDIRKITDVYVKGYCSIEKQNIFFDFTINGEVILPCARTLVDVPYEMDFDVTEIFTTSEHYSKEDEENEIHQITEEVIDLTPYIKENIILNLPYRVFSDEEMIVEGKGWAFYTEDEQDTDDGDKEEKIDPRLKKLKLLLNDQDEKDTK